MLLCKGKQCIWRKVCSRYVIGKGMTQYAGCGDTWIDHCFGAKKFVRKQEQDDACISHAEREQTRDEYPKFIAINSEEGRQVAEKLAKVKNSDGGSPETAAEKSEPKLTRI